jgi:hypothetical protein
MRLQIPKIAIIINPVCGLHKAHHPLSFNLGVWFSWWIKTVYNKGV